jgi:hypothetical protein
MQAGADGTEHVVAHVEIMFCTAAGSPANLHDGAAVPSLSQAHMKSVTVMFPDRCRRLVSAFGRSRRTLGHHVFRKDDRSLHQEKVWKSNDLTRGAPEARGQEANAFQLANVPGAFDVLTGLDPTARAQKNAGEEALKLRAKSKRSRHEKRYQPDACNVHLRLPRGPGSPPHSGDNPHPPCRFRLGSGCRRPERNRQEPEREHRHHEKHNGLGKRATPG